MNDNMMNFRITYTLDGTEMAVTEQLMTTPSDCKVWKIIKAKLEIKLRVHNITPSYRNGKIESWNVMFNEDMSGSFRTIYNTDDAETLTLMAAEMKLLDMLRYPALRIVSVEEVSAELALVS